MVTNNEIPAIKIGRFAIDKKYAGKNLGKFIFRNVLLSILCLSKNKIGLRFITVEAYASAFNFHVEKKIILVILEVMQKMSKN